MYAVIFKAKIKKLDEEYAQVATRMKELALEQYGCLEFVSVIEGENEIAISYWENEDDIKIWKNDPEHILAQELGKTKWYESYKVQIVEVIREHSGNT